MVCWPREVFSFVVFKSFHSWEYPKFLSFSCLQKAVRWTTGAVLSRLTETGALLPTWLNLVSVSFVDLRAQNSAEPRLVVLAQGTWKCLFSEFGPMALWNPVFLLHRTMEGMENSCANELRTLVFDFAASIFWERIPLASSRIAATDGSCPFLVISDRTRLRDRVNILFCASWIHFFFLKRSKRFTEWGRFTVHFHLLFETDREWSRHRSVCRIIGYGTVKMLSLL